MVEVSSYPKEPESPPFFFAVGLHLSVSHLPSVTERYVVDTR